MPSVDASAVPAKASPAQQHYRTGQSVLAVLPLKNVSGDAENDYFVDGITAEIIRNLAVIDGLDVRSEASSFFFKDKPRNLREVEKQLDAGLIIEGSVLRAGYRLQIQVQLVRVAGDVRLWSERFDRNVDDVFAIQDEIARAIVRELRLTRITDSGATTPTSEHTTCT